MANRFGYLNHLNVGGHHCICGTAAGSCHVDRLRCCQLRRTSLSHWPSVTVYNTVARWAWGTASCGSVCGSGELFFSFCASSVTSAFSFQCLIPQVTVPGWKPDFLATRRYYTNHSMNPTRKGESMGMGIITEYFRFLF